MKIDINVLKELSNFGVAPIEMIKGFKQAIASGKSSKAESKYEPILTGNNYIWSDNDSAYHKDDQIVYCFPNGLFLWVWGNVIGRPVQGSSILQKWIQEDEKYPNGKVNDFMELYNQKTGQETTSKPMDRMAVSANEPEEPMSGPVPDRSKIGNPELSNADTIIRQIMKKANINPNAKLSQQHPIRLSADQIIDLYKKAKGMESDDPEGSKKLMDFVKTLKVLEEGHIKKSTLQKLIQEIVRNIVKEVSKKKEVDEETGTAAVSPVTGPNAFKKKVNENEFDGKKWPKHNATATPQETKQAEFVANEIWKDVRSVTLHSASLDNKTKFFKIEKSTDPKIRWVAIKSGSPALYTAGEGENSQWIKFEQGVVVREMTTTSGGGGSSAGTPGYNIPGAFSNRMNNKKHIEVLGYKMTPAGEKEFNRPGDKKI